MKKQYDYLKLLDDMIPSDAAILYLRLHYLPISYTDFTGYAVDLGCMFPHLCKRKQFCLLISWDGGIAIMQFEGSRTFLTNFKVKRLIKQLYKTQFLVPNPDDTTFKEFSEKFELPIDTDKVIIVEERLFRPAENA